MGSRRRFDERPIGRRSPTRAPKRRILVVCEGRETERGYFVAFQHAARNPLVHLEVAKETGVPMTVVKVAIALKEAADREARRERDENLRWDEVWGVFDVDEHPDLERAIALATASAVELAVSNPCFEVWALLHFQDQRAHIERDKLRLLLRRYLPGYEKSLDFARLHPGYGDAVNRANALLVAAERDGDRGRNPSTGVARLTESIRGHR